MKVIRGWDILVYIALRENALLHFSCTTGPSVFEQEILSDYQEDFASSLAFFRVVLSFLRGGKVGDYSRRRLGVCNTNILFLFLSVS